MWGNVHQAVGYLPGAGGPALAGAVAGFILWDEVATDTCVSGVRATPCWDSSFFQFTDIVEFGFFVGVLGGALGAAGTALYHATRKHT